MSRRDQITMTDAEVRDFLSAERTIIITSLNRDGTPHPAPMWFALEDDGALVMTTYAKSQKIRNLERDHRVALLVEDGETYETLRGVQLYGDAEPVRDADAVAGILVAVSAKEGAAVDRSAVMKTASKRTGVRVRPRRVVSWDHRKLGGVY